MTYGGMDVITFGIDKRIIATVLFYSYNKEFCQKLRPQSVKAPSLLSVRPLLCRVLASLVLTLSMPSHATFVPLS